VNRFAQMPSHFHFLLCVAAAGLGCSSAATDPLPFGNSGGTTGSLGGSSSTGNTSGGAPGSAGLSGLGGMTIPIGSSGSTSAGNGGIDKCVGTSSTATPLPPVLAFLIDTSTSMTQSPMMGAPTKWVSTRDALNKAFTDMTLGTGTGLIFYPNVQFTMMPGGFGRGGSSGMGTAGATGSGGTTGAGTNSTCINRQVAVPLAPLDMAQRTAILTALRNKMPSGNTPTHDAYQFAIQTVKMSTLPGPKYVVLVTDGAPTFSLGCVGNGMGEVDASPIVMEAANALKDGIKTFVIGSPGSETARGSLSQMATQGGTALANCSDAGPNYCHFDMTTATDLSAALNDAFAKITGQVVSCNYTIPPVSGQNVLDLTQINVNYTNGAGTAMQIPRDASMTECNHGWQLSGDQKQIMLCPDMCDAVKNDSGAKVEVVFGCKTIAL
jgi:hypothetical protein